MEQDLNEKKKEELHKIYDYLKQQIFFIGQCNTQKASSKMSSITLGSVKEALNVCLYEDEIDYKIEDCFK